MQIPIPLTPTQPGTSSTASVPLANAPNLPRNARHDTAHPVTAGTKSERARPDNEDSRTRPNDGDGNQRRGQRLDILV